jgi:hypothetical protein
MSYPKELMKLSVEEYLALMDDIYEDVIFNRPAQPSEDE